MTHNYFIKCPVCGTVTRMRTPAGYIEKTPVRIHCGECNTLMTGEFHVNNDKIGIGYVPLNCEEVVPSEINHFDYFGEASGEMLCSKVIRCYAEGDEICMPPMGKVSPVFALMTSMSEDDRIRFINYACYCTSVVSKWDQHRIKYDLFLNGKYPIFQRKYEGEARKLHCNLQTKLGVLQFIYRSMFYDMGGLFGKKTLLQLVKEINYKLSHMDHNKLVSFLRILEENDRLKTAQGKLFKVFFNFFNIVPNLIPAIGLLYYRKTDDVDREELGISTCSFDDIKNFYQDTYECLIDCCDIIVGLDNIENREDCNKFTDKLDLRKFREQKKGNRIKRLNPLEFFAGKFALPVDSASLRNAIGHNDYQYDGTAQTIRYQEKEGSEVYLTTYLIDIALECCRMMRSTMVLAYIVYSLQRYDMRKEGEELLVHPMLYEGTKAQSRCPCGSGKKYRQCCKAHVEEIGKVTINLDYPMKADISRPVPVEMMKRMRQIRGMEFGRA